MPTEASLTPPVPDRYVTAFLALPNMTDRQLQMLRLHYAALQRTVTATRLAELMGWASYTVANAQYGRLAGLVGIQIGYNPESERLGTLVRFEMRRGEWNWLMRPEVAKALEQLGWVGGTPFVLPEELGAGARFVEGAIYQVSVNAYERNLEGRKRCLAAYGASCAVCSFNFGAVYGDVAEGFIHVHLLRPLSEIGGAYTLDPVADLRPVCPNCHAVLHRRTPPYSIDEVRAILGRRTTRMPGSK